MSPSHARRPPFTHEWITPPELIAALGHFDLDPCSLAMPPWRIADRHISLPDDGLAADWHGRVWLNPPFGRAAAKWVAKLAAHGNGIALIFARTDTAMYFDSIWPAADALLFVRGRPRFFRADGVRSETNAGAPVVLVAYGAANALALEHAGIPGALVTGFTITNPEKA